MSVHTPSTFARSTPGSLVLSYHNSVSALYGSLGPMWTSFSGCGGVPSGTRIGCQTWLTLAIKMAGF